MVKIRQWINVYEISQIWTAKYYNLTTWLAHSCSVGKAPHLYRKAIECETPSFISLCTAAPSPQKIGERGGGSTHAIFRVVAQFKTVLSWVRR